ncbi:MAG TPA: site-specific integrase [Streptosporangiaceae bacterium]|nr:site-specific integrase [Streptosporangiaceae bacterium]
MGSFDVRVFAIRRRPGRGAFEVRWRVAGQDRSRSFATRALADSYRAELIRAARRGQAFDPATGQPASWAAPEPVTVTWYQHAVAYAQMKWPHLAPHSRASLADALATSTPLLTTPAGRRPPARALRTALYQQAFTPQRQQSREPDPGAARALAWLQRASVPLSPLTDPRVIRAALDGLRTRLNGAPAAPNTISRRRAVFHGALSYAVELGLLPANPIHTIRWRVPKAAAAVNPATVASPAQVQTILDSIHRTRPELAAFFGCLYYAALRPEEAVALHRDDLTLPPHGRGTILLSTACPRIATAWTSTGTPYEPRGLKHRPHGAIRVIPIPPVLTSMLHRHLADHGTAPDGRLFRGTRGGPLSESVYGRAWHTARHTALGPDLAATPSPNAPTTCATPPCPCGSTPPASPPKSPPGPATPPASCTTPTSTASTATTTTPASKSRMPSILAPAARPRHHATQQAVIRAADTSLTPSAAHPPIPPAPTGPSPGHEPHPRPAPGEQPPTWDPNPQRRPQHVSTTTEQ